MAQFNEEETGRIKKAQEAIDAVCDNYKVFLVPQMMIVQGKIVNHSVGIVPQQEESRIIQPNMRKDVEEAIKSNPKGE